jgi:uncharacterized membrane protein YgcG
MKKYLPLVLLAGGLLMAFNRPIMGLISPVSLDIKISTPPVIMSSIYKVYANDEALEGKYNLFKMTIRNNSSVPARNVEVTYSVTDYIDNAVAERIPMIQPGQTVVVNCYPKFPDRIVEKTTESKVTVKTTVKGSNIKTMDNDFNIALKARNQFMYTFIPADEIRTASENVDNMSLLSCLVTPDDPIIKYYTQQIQEKVLKGEQASVGNKEEEGVRVMKGVYAATLYSHTVYSGTSGVPQSIGEVKSTEQKIRLPREVVTGKTGLCIELSVLYASVLACAGMDPVIYLKPGHAFPGFKMNGSLYAIESTGIGGEGLGSRSTPEEALQNGMKELDDLIQHMRQGDDAYMIIDVRDAIKKGAVAMELKDDNTMRQEIDAIARTFDGSAGDMSSNVRGINNGDQENMGGGNNDGGNNGGGGNDGGGGNNGGGGNAGGGANKPSGYNLFEGIVTFAYPSSWRILPRTQYTQPQCKYVIGNSSNNADVEVYSFPGVSNPSQALASVNQWVNKFGYGIQYQVAGNSKGYTLYKGTTGNASGALYNWIGAFKVTNNGVVGISTGAAINTGTKYEQTALNILNSLQ